jgi:hypothetical protein
LRTAAPLLGLVAALLCSPAGAAEPAALPAERADEPANLERAAEAPGPPAPWIARPKPRGLTYGGRLFTSIAPDLRMAGPYEDRFGWYSGLDFRVKYKFAPTARFQIGASFRYDLRHGDTLESDAWVDLGPTYLHLRRGRLTVRVGRMHLIWGRNPLLSPLNVLSPLDAERLFSAAGTGDPRIPVTSARVKLELHPLTLEVVYIPFFQPARQSFFGRDFSLLRPGMLEGLLGRMSEMLPSTGMVLLDGVMTRIADKVRGELLGLDPYVRDGLQSYLVADLPEEFPQHGDIGLRLGLSGPGIEADFYGLLYVLDQPAVQLHESLRRPLAEGREMTLPEMTDLLDPDAPLATPTYYRAFMAGADLSVAHGGFVITGEAAYKSRSVHYTRTLEPLVVPSVEYALALRYVYGTVLGLDVEFAHRILARPDLPELLFEQPHDLRLALMVVVRLLRDRLEVVLGGNWNMLQQDLYLHPKVTVELDDRLSVVFGAQLFFGFQPDVEPTLASIQSYRGGLAGYFRGNDYAYGTLEVSF